MKLKTETLFKHNKATTSDNTIYVCTNPVYCSAQDLPASER